MRVGAGIVAQEICRVVDELFTQRPDLRFNHVLEALEHLRYEITEAAIARGQIETPKLPRIKSPPR